MPDNFTKNTLLNLEGVHKSVEKINKVFYILQNNNLTTKQNNNSYFIKQTLFIFFD